MKKHIPNLFTLGNLLCGCLAMISLLSQSTTFGTEVDFYTPAILVLIGAVLDFFDGFVARLLKVDGELGKQLDSLADMVTFGLVPGLIAFQLCKQNLNVDPNQNLAYVCLIIVLMSAMRLAIFNISTDQSDSFLGIPTPANTLFWIGLPFLLDHLDWENPFLIMGLSIITSILMVVNYKMLALKFKTFGLKGNHGRWLLVVTSIVTLISLTIITGNMLVALPIIIILYIIISVINNSLSKNEL